MPSTKLGIVVERAKQRLDLTFRDESDRTTGSVGIGRDALDTFIAQLVAARELLRPGSAPSMGVPMNGNVSLPPPVEYYTMTAGVDRKSGLPVLGFKVGPELWLSFRIEAEGVTALATLLSKEAAKAAS